MRYEYIDDKLLSLATTLTMPQFIFPERQEDYFIELSKKEEMAKLSKFGKKILRKIVDEHDFWKQDYQSSSYLDQKYLFGENCRPFDEDDFYTVLRELQEATTDSVYVSPKVRAAFFALSTN